MTRMSYREAARLALAEEMRRDPRVWALGEDLGRGGVFGQYQGLQEEFGPERVVDTPISEAAIMAVAVGLPWPVPGRWSRCAGFRALRHRRTRQPSR